MMLLLPRYIWFLCVFHLIKANYSPPLVLARRQAYLISSDLLTHLPSYFNTQTGPQPSFCSSHLHSQDTNILYSFGLYIAGVGKQYHHFGMLYSGAENTM